MKKTVLVALLGGILTIHHANAQFGKLADKVKPSTGKVKEAAEQGQHATEQVQDVKNATGEDVSKENSRPAQAAIFFSTSKPGTAFSRDFSEGDYIYAHIVFPKAVKEYVTDNTLTFDVSYKQEERDDYSVNYVKIDVSKVNLENKELDFDVLAKPADATTVYADRMQSPALIAMVMRLSEPGVKTEFNWKIADLQGSFFLTMKSTRSFADFIQPIQNKANDFAQDDDAMKAVLPDEFNRPSYAFADPQLSKANIIKYLPANMEVLKFVVGPGDDYKVMKNELGIIVYKQTARYIMAAYKDKKTGNCYYDNIIFERPYEGNGKYGSLKVRTNGERIDCSKIK
jgi:hypothetical protein